jgi:DNA polymerase III delta prime subunit
MISDRLRLRRENILKKWKEAALAGYLNSSFRSGGNENDRFGNPVVYNVSRSLESIFEELIDRIHTFKTDRALAEIMKIKSLQVKTPSAAVQFLARLKDIIKDEIGANAEDRLVAEEFEELFAAIDRLMLDAFDYFMESREKIFEIRTKEIRKRSYNLLQRAAVDGPARRSEGEIDDDGN